MLYLQARVMCEHALKPRAALRLPATPAQRKLMADVVALAAPYAADASTNPTHSNKLGCRSFARACSVSVALGLWVGRFG